jgi:hypothetical protein
MEPGVQTPDETLKPGPRLVPGQRLAAGADPAPLGIAARFVSGYLIQLKADVRPSTARPAPTTTSPTCTPGRRSICPAPAGWASTRLPVCWPAKATSRSPPRRIPPRRPPSPAGSSRAECEFGFDMSVRRIYETPRVTKPYSDEQWDAIERSAARSMPS